VSSLQFLNKKHLFNAPTNLNLIFEIIHFHFFILKNFAEEKCFTLRTNIIFLINLIFQLIEISPLLFLKEKYQITNLFNPKFIIMEFSFTINVLEFLTDYLILVVV